MTRPIYLSKTLAAASSNLLGSISSATQAVTINSSGQPLDTPRRIMIASSVSVSSGITFTVTGTIEGGGVKRETIFASTGVALTTLDFLTVTSVSISSATGLPFTIGTTALGGTRWVVADSVLGGPIGATITLSSSSVAMTGTMEWTHDDPTGSWPITRLGQPYPQPTVWTSSSLNAVNTATHGLVNGDVAGTLPVYAYRLTVASTVPTGTVYATVLQNGGG